MRTDDLTLVYVVRNKSSNNWRDLKYSLRSLKNVGFRNVVVVGPDVPWLVDDVKLLCDDDQVNKYGNVISKLLLACDDDRVSDDFVFLNDDFLFVDGFDFVPFLFNGDLRSYAEGKRFGSFYRGALLNTCDWLFDRGLSDLNFELHFPLVFNKSKFKDLFLNVCLEWRSRVLCYRSLYMNFYLGDFDCVEVGVDFKAYSGYDFGRLVRGVFLSSSPHLEGVRSFLSWRDKFFFGRGVFEK